MKSKIVCVLGSFALTVVIMGAGFGIMVFSAWVAENYKNATQIIAVLVIVFFAAFIWVGLYVKCSDYHENKRSKK